MIPKVHVDESVLPIIMMSFVAMCKSLSSKSKVFAFEIIMLISYKTLDDENSSSFFIPTIYQCSQSILIGLEVKSHFIRTFKLPPVCNLETFQSAFTLKIFS